MTNPLNLEEFRKTGVALSHEELARDLQIDPDDFENQDVARFWVYDGDALLLEEEPNLNMPEVSVFIFPVDNKQYSGSKAEMEARLYFDWYTSEIVDPKDWTVEGIDQLIAGYADWKGLEHESLDHMFSNALAEAQQVRGGDETYMWLGWALNVRDAALLREATPSSPSPWGTSI